MNNRAFDLVVTCNCKESLVSVNSDDYVTCLESSGNTLYLGTATGRIISYSIHDKSPIPSSGGSLDRQPALSSVESGLGRLESTWEEWAKCVLPTPGSSSGKRRVEGLSSASAMNRLVAFSDGWMYLMAMDLQMVGQGARMKWVTAFAVNGSPPPSLSAELDPFSIQLVLGTRKRQLLISEIVEDNFRVRKEVPTADNVVKIAVDGECVCFATDCHYYIYDIATGMTSSLFPYSPNDTTPLICRIAAEEFLLTAPSSLGMFVGRGGASNRPPVVFGRSGRITGLAHSHPFIVSLDEEAVCVYGTFDQQLKQVIPFSGGLSLASYDGQLLVNSKYEVYKLHPIAWDKQVQALLADKHVDEALEFARKAHKTGITREDFVKIYRRLEQQACFIQIGLGNWSEARKYAIDGRLDPRELISLYPDLLPVSSNFVRSTPALHHFPDIKTALRESGEDMYVQAQEFLLDLLMLISAEPWTRTWRSEIDTARAKLTCLLDPGSLTSLLSPSSGKCHADLSDCLKWLEEHGQFHTLALCLAEFDRLREAVEIWKKLIVETLSDDTFPGKQSVVDWMMTCPDGDLVMDCVRWLLVAQQDETATIDLIEGYEWQDKLDQSQLISLASKYPKVHRAYVENLVLVHNVSNEKFHTELVELYLKEIIEIEDRESAEFKRARHSLQTFLRRSDFYRPRAMLAKIGALPGEPFAQETAILLGKLGEHEKAMNILVKDCHDFFSAEEYCRHVTSCMTREQRQKVYQTLLKVYLDPSVGENDTAGPVSSKIQFNRQDSHLLVPTLKLLNSPDIDINLINAFEVLPPHWSLSVLNKFLKQSSSKLIAASHRTSLIKGVAEAAYNRSKLEHYAIVRRPVFVGSGDQKECCVCSKTFLESDCFVYPNGTVVHHDCVRYRHICPATGTIFSMCSGTNTELEAK